MDWHEHERPTEYQEEILSELLVRKRVAVRSPHGAGKTTTAAWAVLAFALTREGTDWKVPTTASVHRQLAKFLWPEIRLWARRLRWDKIGRPPFDTKRELLQLSLKLGTGEAFAVASDKPELIEGAHASVLAYVFDEAKAIPAATWDAAEGAFASGECYALAISTPGMPSGRFYEIHSRMAGLTDWWVRHVTLEEAVLAGRVSLDWAKQRAAQWGKRSAVYQNRVLGEFATDEQSGVIPLAWVEAANRRWLEWHEAGRPAPDDGQLIVGVDVGRGGDKSVLALRRGHIITDMRTSGKDTMDTTGRVAAALSSGGKAVVDVIGVGAGVTDRLRERGDEKRTAWARDDVIAFNAGSGTGHKDVSGELGFVNKRAAAWWIMRELLDPSRGSDVALPPDDRIDGDLDRPPSLVGELTSLRQRSITSAGKIRVESKDDVKGRIGHSTDYADAVIQAFAGPVLAEQALGGALGVAKMRVRR